MAGSIMWQGTGSDVGKSILATGFCRLLREEGYRVAPFKAQNMALNSYVTPDGGEIGRAQALQAWAAGVDPEVDMNPILLKPTGANLSQVIVRGRAVGNLSARGYREDFYPRGLAVVRESLESLRRRYDVLVIEGAGSPAEVNLKDRDLVNMRVAEMADSPVLIVADIDRGGALAALLGTWEILSPTERERVRGFVINRFRGDRSLLESGLEWLERRTGVPVVGVMPHLGDLALAGEDSLDLPSPGEGEITVAVPRVPHLSNYTDFDPLRFEPGVRVIFPRTPAGAGEPDAVILPGTKNTMADLLFLRESGWEDWLRDHARAGGVVGGICGGYQMLGEELLDPDHVESSQDSLPGLGLLPVTTTFAPEKILRQAAARLADAAGFWRAGRGEVIGGYEIHVGRTEVRGEELFRLETPEGVRSDGCRVGEVFGSYLHGLFENDTLRSAFLNHLRRRRGLPEREGRAWGEIREDGLRRLVEAIRHNLGWEEILAWAGLSPAEQKKQK